MQYYPDVYGMEKPSWVWLPILHPFGSDRTSNPGINPDQGMRRFLFPIDNFWSDRMIGPSFSYTLTSRSFNKINQGNWGSVKQKKYPCFAHSHIFAFLFRLRILKHDFFSLSLRSLYAHIILFWVLSQSSLTHPNSFFPYCSFPCMIIIHPCTISQLGGTQYTRTMVVGDSSSIHPVIYTLALRHMIEQATHCSFLLPLFFSTSVARLISLKKCHADHENKNLVVARGLAKLSDDFMQTFAIFSSNWRMARKAREFLHQVVSHCCRSAIHIWAFTLTTTNKRKKLSQAHRRNVEKEPENDFLRLLLNTILCIFSKCDGDDMSDTISWADFFPPPCACVYHTKVRSKGEWFHEEIFFVYLASFSPSRLSADVLAGHISFFLVKLRKTQTYIRGDIIHVNLLSHLSIYENGISLFF